MTAVLFVVCFAFQKNNPFINRDARAADPLGRIQDSCQSLADLIEVPFRMEPEGSKVIFVDGDRW